MGINFRAGTMARNRLMAALAVTGLVIAGCSNSGDSSTSSTSSVAVTTIESAADTTAATGETTASSEATGASDTTVTSEGTVTSEASSTDAPTTTEAFQSISGVPGVSDTEIDFSVIGTGPSTNPLGTCTLECYSDGINAYFAFRNSQGGVHGRELKLTSTVDDELGNNQVKSLEIIDANDTFGTFSIPFLATGFPEFAKQGIPLYTTLISSLDTAGQESSFANGGVSCILCSQKYSIYIAEQVGAKTIASLGYGVSQPSKDCVASPIAAVGKYGDALGMTVGYSNDQLPYALPNGIAPEVTAMKEAGVDLVFTCLDGNSVKTLVQEMKRQDLQATVVLPGDGYGTKTFFSDSGDLFEGDVMTVTFRPFEATAAGSLAADFLDWMQQTSPDTSDMSYAMFGWMSADLAYQGLLDAGPSFDRASVVAATNALEDYTGGGAYPPVDWGRQHESATEDDRVTHGNDPQCAALVRITGQTFELLGGTAEKPWVCWDPTNPDYTQPTLMNFEPQS